MRKILPISLRRWRRALAGSLISIASFPVFIILDLLDIILCFFFRFVDLIIEGKSSSSSSSSCYCWRGGQSGEEEVSASLFNRKNVFREVGLHTLQISSKKIFFEEISLKKMVGASSSPRWSDCRCPVCVSWMEKGDERLHFISKEPDQANPGMSAENVIFLHGFLSSSSLWAELIFPNISRKASDNLRLFAVDLLGFGKSPKPGDCLYTLKDHIEMIEQTLFNSFPLESFHLVAHSMGCIMALAIAEKYPGRVKSIALAAPPYFSGEKTDQSLLRWVVPRKVWPPLRFGASVMSWYEHLGRTVCFFVCRFHTFWDWILMVLPRRDLHFLAVDLTKHTHHSAWHTMHNVICGEGKSMDRFLAALAQSGVPSLVVHGSDDQIVPVDCSRLMKQRFPHIDLQVVPGVDHTSIIVGRESEFIADLEALWFSSIASSEKTH
ncbi:alpha/beta-Hydrolases superfamily protein [Wolffia australiana]